MANILHLLLLLVGLSDDVDLFVFIIFKERTQGSFGEFLPSVVLYEVIYLMFLSGVLFDLAHKGLILDSGRDLQ